MVAENNTVLDTAAFDLTCALQPVRRAWRKAAAEVVQDADITPSLAAVLLMLYRIGPSVQQKILALEVGINAAALVRMLDKGEALGLLARTDMPEDRRSKAICLLPEGEKLAVKMEDKLLVLRRRLFENIPPDQIRTAVQVLRSLEEKSQAVLNQERS
nr:MarR family transcriptional regulator [uncultured Desulfobacter sp.]